MPVLSSSQVTGMRTRYRRMIHNHQTSVKKRYDNTTVQPDPRFQSRTQTVFVKWDDFYCSMFHFLSGKTDRLLSEKGQPDLIAQLGLSTDTTIVVQYVPGLVLAVPDLVGSTINPPPETAINDLEVDDEVWYSNEWWRVRTVIPDSEGVQHTVFACK